MKTVRRAKPIPDGKGSIQARAAAWSLVEDAERKINELAAIHPALTAEYRTYRHALLAWSAAPDAEVPARWREVSEAQQALNAAARQVDELRPFVDVMEKARAEYLRIGGSETRVPGAGGLA